MRNNRPAIRPRSASFRRYSFRPMVGMFIVLLALTLTSCNHDSPTSSTSANLTTDKSATLTTGVAISDGMPGADSSAALFTIDFGVPPKSNTTDDGAGEARAIAFSTASSASGETDNGHRAGIDIGSVTLATGSQTLALQKISDRHGVAYSLRGVPGSETGTGVAFEGGATYTFNVSGSDAFTASSFSINAPAARLAFSNVTEGQAVSKSSDLAINWTGGYATSGAQLRISPAPPAFDSSHRGPFGDTVHIGIGVGIGRGEGGSGGPGHGGPGGPGGPGHGGPGGPMGPGDHDSRGFDSTRVVVLNLSSNSGSATVTAAQLQAIVSGLNTSDVVISISQCSSVIATHDGKQVRVGFRDDAHVKVTLQ